MIYKNKLLNKFIVLLLILLPSVVAGKPFRPDAPFKSGFGIDSYGGGGRHLATPDAIICKVVNLNDSGSVETDQSDGIVSGSLRYCLEDLDPTGNAGKVVIFEVSGTIDLDSPIYIEDSYITIAGQTAPPPGITIKDETLVIDRNVHDIIIQHLRFRLGEAGSQAADYLDAIRTDQHYRKASECIDTDDPWLGCTGQGTASWSNDWTPPYNLVFDHISASWGVDETIDNGGDNVVLIDSIIGEGLNESLHGKGAHSKGLILQAYNSGSAGNQNVAVIRNLFLHNNDRNPFQATGDVLISNNVMYDFLEGIRIDDHGAKAGTVKSSVVGNYLIGTDITSRWIYYICNPNVHPNSRFYLGADNYYNGKIQTDSWNSTDLTMCGDFSGGNCNTPIPSEKKLSGSDQKPIWPIGYSSMTALNAKTYVLENAGAYPAFRDTVDTRYINETNAASNTSAFIDTVAYTNSDCTGDGTPMGCCTGNGVGTCIRNDENGWPTLTENTRTLTPPTNWNTVEASGYTRLEEWLQDFAYSVEERKTIRPNHYDGDKSITIGGGSNTITISQ